MSRAPLPKKGCFKASYPSTEWQEVPCAAPPSNPLPRPRGRKSSPNTVGATSGDFAAQVSSGLISTAEGSFPSVTPGITEIGTAPKTGKTANAFTLQLNTNTFTTPACNNGDTGCTGWQQFVFQNDGDGSATATAFIQYWLIGYGPGQCPSGWSPGGTSAPNDCYTNSTMGMGGIPVQTMADLAQISLTGTAGVGGMDTLTLMTPAGDLYAMGSSSTLDLAQSWNTAEFNIFGDGNSTEANFKSGTTIVVKTSVDSNVPSTSKPLCVEESLTAETDNLNLVPTCCPYGGASPFIEFMETNAANPAASCRNTGLQAFTRLTSFHGTDGKYPNGLVQGTDGNFYGTTTKGGALEDGTVFKITPSGARETMYSFCAKRGCADGGDPEGDLVQATDGNLYGTTLTAGANIYYGTVFKITPAGTFTLTTLHTFCSQSNCADGGNPEAGLIQATNGDFYGTTGYIGAYNGGTVFKMTPSGGLTTLYSFCAQSNCTDGSTPEAVLVQSTNGELYGTTAYGGANSNACPSGCGTVFKITPAGTLTTLYSFCSLSDCADGAVPFAPLVQATNGDLYGTTEDGGANGGGTVFKITPAGTLTTLHSFCSLSNCADGANPVTGLIQATDGNLYGVTQNGGAAGGGGTVFKITPAGALTTLHSFCALSNCADGHFPYGLIQATDGALYVTVIFGGANGLGTLVSLYVGLGPFVETRPASGEVGSTVEILGTNLTGASTVTFNGVTAEFTLKSPTLITATVPPGATTGEVQVVTPGTTLKSNVPFRVP
jgi:uncharacterized repeat protein (TIGR03803 family)